MARRRLAAAAARGGEARHRESFPWSSVSCTGGSTGATKRASRWASGFVLSMLVSLPTSFTAVGKDGAAGRGQHHVPHGHTTGDADEGGGWAPSRATDCKAAACWATACSKIEMKLQSTKHGTTGALTTPDAGSMP